MYNDQFAIFVLFSVLTGIFHSCCSGIQVMTDTFSADFFQTCDLQDRHHLVNRYTIINECRDSKWFCDCICNHSTKVGCMLHCRFVFQLPYHVIIYTVSACLQRRKQTTTGNDTCQILQFYVFLFQNFHDHIFTELILIYDQVIFCNLICRMRNALYKNLLFILIISNFCRCGTGI